MVVEPKDIQYKGKGRKGKNKRDYFRLNERLKISAQLKPERTQPIDDLIVERTGKVFEFYTQDISAGGMQFFSKTFFRENSYLEITLNFKETDPPFEPVKVNVVIIRSEQVENSRYYNVSAMFVGMSEIERSHIERYIFLRQREMIADKKVGFL